jgi:hypothetical protein
MGNKLYKYDGFNEATNTIYSGFSLNNAYVFGDEIALSGMTDYSDITSIESLDSIGGLVNLKHYDLRGEIKLIYDNDGVSWSGYTIEEKKILSKYFLVDGNHRDDVLTQQEQDDFNHFKLYDYLSDDVVERLGDINEKTTPKSIDYKKDLIIRLHPELKFNDHGFLTGCTYYTNLDITLDAYGFSVFNFSNPIVDYSATYTSGSDGYVQSRVITRKWYMMDDTLSPDAKVSVKIYDPLTSRAEGRRRRKNLINRLLIDTVGLIIITSGDLDTVSAAEEDAIPFMHDIEGDISAYYESGTKEDVQGNPCSLIQTVSAHTYGRLDNFVPGTNDTVTIRMFILSRLDPQ